jgi:hypothetical protein
MDGFSKSRKVSEDLNIGKEILDYYTILGWETTPYMRV